ncbi:MAG: RNA polymerase sigma factor [Chloracidobacterium sp.]|nr:RNA polymerase sigma factor [Chloracidobacterium sp.]MDW8218227.1 RNA polymerase sigma factor [Acidobacteriota bacterium]
MKPLAAPFSSPPTPAAPPTDAEVARAVLAGHVELFRLLVERHQRRVFNLAYRMTGNRSDAEDIAQDVFVKLYEHLARYDAAQPLENWLMRIASNYTLNWLEKNARRTQRTTTLDSDDERQSPLPTPDPSPSAPATLERREVGMRLLAALQTLPVNQRLVVVLRYLDDLSVEEIAALLGAPKNTVKTWLARGRDALRIRLGDLTLE